MYLLVSRYKSDVSGSLATHSEVIFFSHQYREDTMVKLTGDSTLNITFVQINQDLHKGYIPLI